MFFHRFWGDAVSHFAAAMGLIAALGVAQAVAAIVGDEPAIAAHMDQADIDSGGLSFNEIITHGQDMFSARYNTMDGQGRPATRGDGAPRDPDEPLYSRVSGPDASSCSGCHNQPRMGGSGEFVTNAFVLAEAADPVETDTSPSATNMRNPPNLFGTGAIDMLAREMTTELQAIRAEATAAAASAGMAQTRPLVAKGVDFGEITVRPDGRVDPTGIEGVDWDLIIKPFHQSGAAVSIRHFANGAEIRHFGIEPSEAVGVGVDQDQDGLADEATIGDMTALTVWIAALNTPAQVIPTDAGERALIEQGEMLFDTISCTDCHRTLELDSPLYSEPNPFNPPGVLHPDDILPAQPYAFDMTAQGPLPRLEPNGAGGAIVRAFTDLRRHNLSDDDVNFYANDELYQGSLTGFAPSTDFTAAPAPRSREQHMTARLWVAGSSDPYGHSGDVTTLYEAIAYHGGEARPQRDAFLALPESDQEAVVTFVRSLQVVPDGSPIGAAPQIATSPEGLDFGNAHIDAGQTAPMTVIIANTGTDILTIGGVALTGPAAGEFLLAADTGQRTLLPTEARAVDVAFDPATLGLHQASLTITSDAHGAPSIDVSLMGGGTIPMGSTGLVTPQIVRAITGASAQPPPAEDLDVNEDSDVDSADVVTNENDIYGAP